MAGGEAGRWVERRLPAWTALSELFLDTELGPADWDGIARAIAGAGFTPEEAEAILETEVAPVFWSNLVSPAGQWAGWTETSVGGAVAAHLGRGHLRRWLAVRLGRTVRRLYAKDWSEVRRRLVDRGA